MREALELWAARLRDIVTPPPEQPCEAEEREGVMTDVLHELYWSLLNKRPISEELSAAFIERYLKGRNGEIRSWDKVFGKPTRYGTGENIKRQTEQGRLVADEVARVEATGGSLNEEEFEAIGRRTAVGGKTKVKTLLASHRFWTERVNRLLDLGREISKNYRR